MRRALVSKLGTDRLAEISSSQLLAEIERVSVQKQLDLLNTVKLFEAVQGPSEPIRNFVFRLQMLAYECNFTTSCSSQNCTAANYGGIILFELVRGLANGDIKEEILSMLDQISLEDAITIVSKRKSEEIEAANARMPNQNVGFRNTPRKSKRGPKVVTTCHMAQRGDTQTKVLPDKDPRTKWRSRHDLPGPSYLGSTLPRVLWPHSPQTPASTIN